MSNSTPPPGSGGYSEDPTQAYPTQPTDRPQQWPSREWGGSRPVGPDRNRMPWYGKGCLGIVAGFFLLVALAIVFGDPASDTEPVPDPPATTQPAPEPEPEPEPEPTPEITYETVPTPPPGVVEEAGGDRALRNLNELSDDPSTPGDEAAYLNYMLVEDRDVYMSTENQVMLDMGRVVCGAYVAGHSTQEITSFFPAEITDNTAASVITGAVFHLCPDHTGQLESDVQDWRDSRAAPDTSV